MPSTPLSKILRLFSPPSQIRRLGRRKPPFFRLWINEPGLRGHRLGSVDASPDVKRDRSGSPLRAPFGRSSAVGEGAWEAETPRRGAGSRDGLPSLRPSRARARPSRKTRPPELFGSSTADDGVSARERRARTRARVYWLWLEADLGLDATPKAIRSRLRGDGRLLRRTFRRGAVPFAPRCHTTLTDDPRGGTLARGCFGSRGLRFRGRRSRSDAEPPRSSGK